MSSCRGPTVSSGVGPTGRKVRVSCFRHCLRGSRGFMGVYGIGVPSFWKLPEIPPVTLFTCFSFAFKGEIQGWLEGIVRLDGFEGISQCGLQHLNSSSMSAHPHQIWCLLAFCAVKSKWEALKLFLLPRKEKYYPRWQNHQILLCANQCYIFQSSALKDII